jgi:hypothetical protein
MKVKQEILDKIDNPQSRTRIAMQLNQGEQSIALACRANQDNGTLTKMAALKAISEIVGIPVEEILEDIPVKESQN